MKSLPFPGYPSFFLINPKGDKRYARLEQYNKPEDFLKSLEKSTTILTNAPMALDKIRFTK